VRKIEFHELQIKRLKRELTPLASGRRVRGRRPTLLDVSVSTDEHKRVKATIEAR
jgi:hypothetical protein